MKNEILNIIEDYERWLQERITNFGDENVCNLILLTEKGGTKYKDFKKIYDTIIASVVYAQKDKEGNNIVLYNKTPIDNAFLGNIVYKIIYDKIPKIDGGYAHNSGRYNEEDEKMYDARFVFTEKDLTYPQIGSDSFAQTVWHELQHAYVQYNVLKRLYDKGYIKNPKMSNQRKLYDSFLKDEELEEIIKNTFYYTNINEINSHLNEMIPYLEKHSEINFTNYKNYLNEIPGYWLVQLMQKMYKNLLFVIENDKDDVFRKKFGTLIMSKYKENDFYRNKNITPIQCANRTLKRVCDAVLYTQKQFYKILAYTLKKLNRKQTYNEYYSIKKPLTAEDFDREWIKLIKEFNIKLI